MYRLNFRGVYITCACPMLQMRHFDRESASVARIAAPCGPGVSWPIHSSTTLWSCGLRVRCARHASPSGPFTTIGLAHIEESIGLAPNTSRLRGFSSSWNVATGNCRVQPNVDVTGRRGVQTSSLSDECLRRLECRYHQRNCRGSVNRKYWIHCLVKEENS